MASGSGAAAAQCINGDAAAGSDLKPEPPTTTPSGRPKGSLGREASSACAVEQDWLVIFQEIAGSSRPITKDDGAKCAALATLFQEVTSSVVSMCLATGLDEDKVRSALKENMFKSVPNPQDGALADASSSSTAVPQVEAERASAVQDKRRGTRSSVSSAMSSMPCLSKKKDELPALKEAGGTGFMICKHLEGSPHQVYDMGHQVGEGTFGSVHKARHRQTGQIHAVKQVPKSKVIGGELWAEIGIMKQLDHPHIMRLYYTFEDESYIFMASEMCAGGELYDTLEETGFFPERAAANLMRQILGAVVYLHSSKHIAHRDLKPENFLVLKRVEHEALHLKLIDFGTAKRFDQHPLKTKVCTAHYVAPEVLKRGDVEYTEKVDVWSCGVILYMLLCGFMPFHHDDDREILKIVKKGKYSFTPSAVWGLISDAAKDLIRQMMCVKLQDRCSANEAFEHHWTQSQVDGAHDLLPNDNIIKSMRQFLTNNRLKRVALQIIARQISDDGITNLRNIFQKIDSDHSGTLTIQEMDQALLALEVPEHSRQEMAAIMRTIDVEGSGELEYTEFLAAMLTQEQYLKEDICRGAFCLLDVDGDGTLSNVDLHSLMTGGSGEVSFTKAAMEEIEQIMNEVDENGDGGVSFEEFWGLMKDEGPQVNNTAISLRWQRGKKEAHINVDSVDLGEDDADCEEAARLQAA